MIPKDDDEIALVDEVLSTARSVRRNLDFDRPLEPRVLLDCIDVAVQAPTGIIGENWRFIVVDAPQQKQAVADLYREILVRIFREREMPMKPTHQALMDRLHEIPAMIFVCADGQPLDNSVGAQVGYFGSIMPAAWSLMLALRARNIGATWTTLLNAANDQVREILSMSEEVVPMVMLPVGYTKGAVMKRAARLPAAQVTYWNHWGNSA
ncbi:MAG: nitroreductase family protein [Pseudomonadota bacterium]